jgi:hypothetical protein
VRKQVELTLPLYERRQKTVSQIPHFWPLVLEQAPPDIDQFIQPSDSALLLSSLTSLSVSHFELPGGDPRSVAIRFEFAENDVFEDKVIEKKFWYRKSNNGWSGLVSEPLSIKWKKGKDLTGGLLDLVVKAWDGGKVTNGKEKSSKMTPDQKALKKKIEGTGMGGLSFFAWFGFIGRRISAEESAEAVKKEEAARKAWQSGEKLEQPEILEPEEDDELDLDEELEIFPDGDDLAVAITEDLWPGAIKYFSKSHSGCYSKSKR